jgi:FkbM family methyltransferase
MHIIRHKYPIEAMLRDNSNSTITLHDHFEVYNIVKLHYHKDIEYDPLEDSVTVSLPPHIADNKSEIKLYGAISNGEVADIFMNNIYQYLPVKGNIVIDIGANIGDSSIYFALCGASKVIGIEPFPKNYGIAKKNIELNNLSNKITILLAACGSSSDYITVDPDLQGKAESATAFKQGVKVPLLTLENILNENNISSSDTTLVLKMDCEGCEYDAILSSSASTLRRFSYIQIEYHFGYKNLKEKLEKCGFSVSVTRPTYMPINRNAFIKQKNDNMEAQYIGYINAKRN